MPLPPYLSSAASSRAHHALLVKHEGAGSLQAEDAVLAAEVERCRGVLASGASSSRIATTLIILLHCATMTRTPLDLEFALVPALQLAEGGKTMRERRMGYLYLAERLPPGHELHLMLINTIRKDLASTAEAHILAALHAIAHLPGPDLAPAVVPLLTSKRLLEHPVPTVRQRTIQAISCLSTTGGIYPLSLREIARRIRHEDDDSVLASLLRIFAQSLDSGAREADAARRRRQLDSVFTVASRKMDADSPLVIAAIRALVAIVRTLPRKLSVTAEGQKDALAAHVVLQVRSLLADAVELHTTPGVSPWARACLLETSALAMALYEVDGELSDGVEMLLDHLRRLLVPPPDKGKGKATRGVSAERKSNDTANNRILVLQCFSVLPAVAWQDGLKEQHMSTLMGGVDSTDPTIRKETLRLLRQVDRNLPSLTLESHLEAVRTGRGLPLPTNLAPNASQAQAVAEGRIEAACRALEAGGVLAEGLSEETRGTKLAENVGTVSAALRSGDNEIGVWLKGTQLIIADLIGASTAFRRAFIDTLSAHLASDPEDATAAVLVTTAAVEYPVSDAATSIDALIAALPVSPPTVQELVVLALVPLLARLEADHRGEAASRVTAALKDVRDSAIKHMAKRCREVELIVERDLVDSVVQKSKSRALNDILDAILATYADAKMPSPKTSGSASPSPTEPRRKSYPAAALRYAAYDSPTPGDSGSRSGSGSRGSGGRSPHSPNPDSKQRSYSSGSREEIPMDDLAISRHGGATPTDRTPRLRATEP